jgi:hypothetical protein
MTPWAAKWTACWEEPHCRSTLVPGTSTGNPGRQQGVACDVQGLVASLRDAADDHVVDECGVQAVSLDERVEDRPEEGDWVDGRERLPACPFLMRFGRCRLSLRLPYGFLPAGVSRRLGCDLSARSLRGEDGLVREKKWAAGALGLGIERTIPRRTFRWRHGQEHYSRLLVIGHEQACYLRVRSRADLAATVA